MKLRSALAVSQKLCSEKNEDELRQELKAQAGERTFAVLVKLKIKFWDEYESAVALEKPLRVYELSRGVCQQSSYYTLFDKFPGLFAWVASPLTDFLTARKQANFFAEERMLDILSISAVKSDGKVDSRLAKAQIELYLALQDRLHGGVTQKIQTEQKSVNVNVHSTQTAEDAAKTIGMITDVGELERRIVAIKAKREALRTLIAAPIEVNPQKLMRPDLPETHDE